MPQLKKTQLNKKLLEFRKRRNLLEIRFANGDIKKLNTIYKKINLIYKKLDNHDINLINKKTGGGENDSDRESEKISSYVSEDNEPSVEITHGKKSERILLESDESDNISDESDNISDESELEESELEDNISDESDNILDESELKETELDTNTEPESIIKRYNTIRRYNKNNKYEELKIPQLEKLKKMSSYDNFNNLKELMMSDNWNNFEELLKSILIEDKRSYFKTKIFKFKEKSNLLLLLFMINWFLSKESIEEQSKKLQNLNLYYPELFTIKLEKEDNWILENKKSVNSGIYDYVGKDLFEKLEKNEDSSEKIREMLKLSEIFPEFMDENKFCKLINDTKKVKDIIHLIPFLSNEHCQEEGSKINWNKKLEMLMNEELEEEEKNEYIILFFLSIPNIEEVSGLLQIYRRKYFDFKIMKLLLSVLNFDKGFSSRIKNKKILENLDEKILKLRENDDIKNELWFWIKRFALSFINPDEKYYYFEILTNYFSLIPKEEGGLFKKLGTKLGTVTGKGTRNLKNLKLKENILFIFENYDKMKKDEKMPDLLKQTASFFNKYKFFISDTYQDKNLNIQLYNLILENKEIYKLKDVNIKDVKLDENNLKGLIKIKFESKMLHISEGVYKKQMKIIDKIGTFSDVRKLRADFYGLIKKEIDAKIFNNVIFINNNRINPKTLLVEYVIIKEEKLKKLEEEEEEFLKKKLPKWTDLVGPRTITQEIDFVRSELDKQYISIQQLNNKKLNGGKKRKSKNKK